ncbi:UDP-glucose 4-epimerase [Photobacterium frigidiphilum]|uniref:UDP-glucose 4-epimerase n=1 Tax=Photobacterium frigidiphilum TaxID=264736 RepID=A0A2T3JPV0_9GAMM|nr:SDR family oxidoreductase [Photobacterium frigidiphilum]PSU51082.1 UDP-glucose 4-epimerase [Photobacterium frigidiphilum]
MNKRILVTGVNGFVGSFLKQRLGYKAIDTTYLTRNKEISENVFQGEDYIVKSIDSQTKWMDSLEPFSCIIHCAARVHLMNDVSLNPIDEYREINTAGTLNLARQAAKSGVKRFIFISSIKVNGEATELGHPFKAIDRRAPEDFYGQSKSEAEEQLLELAEETGLEVVIIRPTLVYGPGVKANFASLLNLVSKGLPLPFGCITNNKRSLVSVNNLVDLIMTCIDHPKAVNQVFLVSDDNDLSTASMVEQMSKALGKPNRLIPIPLWCYYLAGKLFGKQDVVNRLLGSLQVDISHTKEVLGWTPPQSVEDGFQETVDALLVSKKESNYK